MVGSVTRFRVLMYRTDSQVVSTVFSIPSQLDASPPQHPRQPLREFVGGVENAALLVAADSLVTHPQYNPLLLYGASGLGKSHLLRALCERAVDRQAGTSVLFLTADDYCRSFEKAQQVSAVPDLRERHRNVDVLAIDDLHALADKELSQQELLYTIDERVSTERIVLLASRVPPAELVGLLRGLQSRLASGLALPIAEPGEDAREAILDELTNHHEVQLTQEAKQLLIRPGRRATRKLTTVGQLQNALLELNQCSNDSHITATMVRSLISTPPQGVEITVRKIAKLTARYFSIRTSDVLGRSRRQTTVRARGVAIYLSRRLLGASFEELGRQFGGRDHSTTTHAYYKTEGLLETDPLVQKAIDELSKELGVP